MIALFLGAAELTAGAGATGADPSFIGQLVLALGALSVAGLGGGYLMGKRHNVNISPHPLTVKEQEQYATRGDLAELKDDLKEIKKLMRDSEQRAHKRMDDMSEPMQQLLGKIDLITSTCKISLK